MTTQIKQFLDQFLPLPDYEFQDFMDLAQEQHIKKREHLIRAGETSHKIAFFFDGYFRFYHYLADGTEVTSDFYFAPNIVTSYTSLITETPSQVYVQAMEDMDLLILTKSGINELYSKYTNFEKLGRLLAEQVAITSERHLFALLNYSAAERYQYLLENHRHFIENIPLQYIASYLGITKETLSRIRKKFSGS